MASSLQSIPVKTILDMSFVHVFKVTMSTWLAGVMDKKISGRSNVIDVSNKFGLIFAANSKTLKVTTIACVDEKLTKMKSSSMPKLVDDLSATTVELDGDVSQIRVNSDKYLAVCLKKNGFIFVEIYDITAFAQEKPHPFAALQLTTSIDDHLIDFSWNPSSVDDQFVVVTSSGSASIFEVHPTEIKELAVLKPSNQISRYTCACWGPIGLILAFGNESGEVVVFHPGRTEMKELYVIPLCPEVKEKFGDVKVLDLWCEELTEWFIVYKSKANQKTEPQMAYCKIQANQTPFTFYGDVCLGSSQSESSRYQFNPIRQWNLLLVSSATSSEMCLMMKEKDVWYKCIVKNFCFPPEDHHQARCTRSICFLFGSGYGWEVRVKSSGCVKEVASLPMLVMSTDGCLSLVQLVTCKPEHHPFYMTPQPITLFVPPQPSGNGSPLLEELLKNTEEQRMRIMKMMERSRKDKHQSQTLKSRPFSAEGGTSRENRRDGLELQAIGMSPKAASELALDSSVAKKSSPRTGIGPVGFGGFQRPEGAAFGASAVFGDPRNVSGAFGAPPSFHALPTSMGSQGRLFGSNVSSLEDFGSLARQRLQLPQFTQYRK